MKTAPKALRISAFMVSSRDHGIELLHLCDASAFGGTLRLADLPHDLCFQSIDADGLFRIDLI